MTLFISLGCATRRSSQTSDNSKRLTVGTVQKEIRKGMSGAEVSMALGSPNIVSTDENGNEVWIYDKLNTQKAYSGREVGVWFLILGGGSSEQRVSSSQRTLTVVVKFDSNKRVTSVSYHSSRF